MPDGRTWTVMVRDVSDSVIVQDQPSVVVCLVLDTETGLVLGFGLDATRSEACRGAFERAVAEAPEGVPFPPGPPARVLCKADDVKEVGAQLAAVVGAGAPSPEEVVPGEEAEEIVDSLVGHLAGPERLDAPTPDDWAGLFRAALMYAEAEPWQQPRDHDDLRLLVTIDGEERRYVPAIFGQKGSQRGLVLYPGDQLPDTVKSWPADAEGPPPVPDGTVVFNLYPRDKTPSDGISRALRHDWPADAQLFPFFATITGEGPFDLTRHEVLDMTTAAVAIVDLVEQSELVPDVDGAVDLADGRQAEYVLESRAATEALSTTLSDALASRDPQALLSALLGLGGHDLFSRPSQRGPRRDDVVTYQVRVDIKDAKPPLWRRLEISSDLMLDELHDVLQEAFDWTDTHLHQFGAGPTSFYDFETEHFASAEGIDADEQEDGAPEDEVRLDEVLAEPGDRLFYMYDFGDGWEHVVRLEKVLPRGGDAPRAVCTKGRRPSPPEDCGGIGGYELAVLANDPSDPEHHDALDRFQALYGANADPAAMRPIPFDIDEINDRLGARFA